MPQYKTKTTGKSPYQIQVLGRALAALELLSQEGPDLALTEISERLGLHKSTAHRLIMVLERYRLIEKNSVTGRYRLGLKLFELGTKAVSQLDLRERAHPYLERAVIESGETVHLCILDDGEVIYVDKVEPARSVRMASTVGKRNPSYCTAVGKAILAHLPSAQVEAIVRKQGLRPLTKNTITTLAGLQAELAKVRARGYAIDDEEIEEGVRCVGCVVQGPSGEPFAAISISGPTFRVTREKIPILARSVIAAAKALSTQLGFHGQKIKIARVMRA